MPTHCCKFRQIVVLELLLKVKCFVPTHLTIIFLWQSIYVALWYHQPSLPHFCIYFRYDITELVFILDMHDMLLPLNIRQPAIDRKMCVEYVISMIYYASAKPSTATEFTPGLFWGLTWSIFSFPAVFCRPLFAFFYLFHWPWHCVVCFELQLLIISFAIFKVFLRICISLYSVGYPCGIFQQHFVGISLI